MSRKFLEPTPEEIALMNHEARCRRAKESREASLEKYLLGRSNLRNICVHYTYGDYYRVNVWNNNQIVASYWINAYSVMDDVIFVSSEPVIERLVSKVYQSS